VGGGRSGGLCALLLALSGGAAAQAIPNRATRYLFSTDVSDARALWVNPAGLGRLLEASVHLDLTVGDPGPAGRLRQLTAGFNSRGFSLGYQRDVLDGGARDHTYRLGFAGGHGNLAGGVAASLYRGAGAGGTGWDAGLEYDVAPQLTVGGVIENVRQPVVHDSALHVNYLPGATLRLLGPRLALSAQGRFSSDGAAGYAFGVRAGLREGSALPIRLLARVDTDGSLRRTALAFGLAVGGQDAVGVVATTPGDAGRLDALSLYGLSTRRVTR
jgi:hypothetical protein